MGFSIGIILGPLLKPLCRIHVLWLANSIDGSSYDGARVPLTSWALKGPAACIMHRCRFYFGLKSYAVAGLLLRNLS